MTDLLAQPWFWPAVVLVVGLPVTLLVLGEVHTALVRRGSRAARIVTLVRDVLVPIGALLLLFSFIPQTLAPALSGDGFTWTKVAATAFGLVIILVLLSGLNFAVFVTAKRDTWRDRLPSIFVDLARVIIIAVSLAVLLGWIWGADIGGLFTALGVGSIVIGLALQNAVGAVLSGLFLQFERPFEQGDYIVTGMGKGRVVAVNWRATHLDTGNGILVIPNSELAGASFSNLTRASSPYEASTVLRFATDDPPQEVIDLLVDVARGMPALAPGSEPSAVPLGKADYEVNIPLSNPARQYGTLGLFRTRLWYAARRSGVHLDRDLTDAYATFEHTRAELLRLAPQLSLSRDDAEAMLADYEAAPLASRVRLERYGEGEAVQRVGDVPDALRVILSGAVELDVEGEPGSRLRVARLGRDDMLGVTALTRQPVGASATAIVEVAVIVLPVTVLDGLVKTRPQLALDIGTAIDHRHSLGEKALAKAGLSPIPGGLVIA